jgi:hypothetical protein
LSNHRIYKYTSIGRPLDPAFPTNKAVLILLPVAAILGAVWAWKNNGQGVEILQNALSFMMIVFGCWALARELFPDDSPAAFISMGLGLVAALSFDSPGILILFATLGLVRLVNRSTGLAARKSDSIIVMLMVFGVIYSMSSPFFGAVAALAFLLDGSLKDPLRRQWLFALICLGGMIVYMVDHDVGLSYFQAPDSLLEWLSIAVLLVLALDVLLLNKVHTVADATEKPLDLGRVKGGMAVVLLAALQGLAAIESVILLVMSVAGIGIGMAFRKAFQAPVNG